MVVLAWKQPSSSIQGAASGDLQLRVIGTARDGQIVRLAAMKCTIGSASGCTLRLVARGVRPVHCLILRGARGTVARAWAPGTHLNGEPLTDSLLVPGDRLTVGPVELEVLGTSAALTPPSAEPAKDERSSPPATTLVSERPRNHRPAPQARERSRKLLGLARALRDELAQHREQAAQIAVAEQERQMRAAEFNDRLGAFHRERQEWEASRQGLQATMDARERQLALEFAQLEAARQSLRQQRQHGEQEIARTRLEIEEKSQSLRHACEEFARTRESFEQQCAAWTAQTTDARVGLQAQQAELADQCDQQTRRLDDLERRESESQAHYAAQLADLEEEHQAWLAERKDREAELAARRAAMELEQAQAADENQRRQDLAETSQKQTIEAAAALREAREQWDQERQALERLIVELRSTEAWHADELKRQSLELEAARQELTKRELVVADAETFARSAAAELDQLRSDLETQTMTASHALAQHQEVRGAYETEYRQRSERLDDEREQLEALQADLVAREMSNTQSRMALAAAETDLDDRQAELAAEYATAFRQLEQDRLALAAERETHQVEWTEQQQWAAEVDRNLAELEAKAGELRKRESLVEQAERLRQAKDEELHQAHAELERHAAETRHQIESERAAWQQQCQEQASDEQQRRSDLDRLQHQLNEEHSEQQQRQAELHQADIDLQNARQALERERAAFADEQAKLLEEQRMQNVSRTFEGESMLAAAEARLLSERAAWEAIQQAAETELRSRGEELKRRHEELEERAATLSTEAASQPDFSQLKQTLLASQAELDARTGEFAQEQAAWQEAQAQRDADHAQQTEELRQQAAMLQERAAAAQAEREELARACDEQSREIAERAQAADRLASECEAAREVFESERQAHHAEHEKAVEALLARETELAQREQLFAAERDAAINATREELAREREALAEERAEAVRHLEQEAALLDQQRAELEAERTALATPPRSNEPIEAEPDHFAEPAVTEVAADVASPQDEESLPAEPETDEIAEAAVVDEASEYEAADQDFESEQADARRPGQDPVGKQPRSGDEQSIEECFAALLNRYREPGAEAVPVAVPAPARKRRKADAPSPAQPTEPAVNPAPAARVEQVMDVPTMAIELERRSAPAETTDLAAMRDLANTHARFAIRTHGKKTLLKESFVTWTACTFCLTIALLILVLAPSEHSVMRTGAMAGIVAAVFWMLSALRAAGKLFVLGQPSGQGSKPSEPAQTKENDQPMEMADGQTAMLEAAGRADVVEVAQVVADLDVVEHPTQ